MPWKPIKGLQTSPESLPGERGRHLIFLGPPIIPDGPRWVHFSWRNESFCIRDFIKGLEMRQEPGLTASDVWRAAIKKKPATGEFFHPVEDIAWWADAMSKL